MSLDAAILAAGLTPVPGLSAAFAVLKIIISCVQEVQAGQKQLSALASALGRVESSRLTTISCVQPLKDLMRFVEREQNRKFLKALFHRESRVAAIELFYRRIGTTTKAFQISALLNLQRMLQENERARVEDVKVLNARFNVLENNHIELRRTLDVNQQNMVAMMVSIERRMEEEGRKGNDAEQRFYLHTLQYLTSTSGQEIKVEDWMISSFEVDYGAEIGAGGLQAYMGHSGTVFKGTWNRTEVAIKLIHNTSGIVANVGVGPLINLQDDQLIDERYLELMRKEIDLTSYNSLDMDDAPTPEYLAVPRRQHAGRSAVRVMPLIPHNAREFLRTRPDFDPVYILRDISLGLEYLHSRKICHGDLKGINVLVEGSGRALLCDFGLARLKADITSRTRTTGVTAVSGSRNWMAPELLSGSLPRTPSDIYAFDEIPMSTIPFGDFIELVFKLGVRPDRPDEDESRQMSDGIWDLAERCWDKSPRHGLLPHRSTTPSISS
ncbi:kinase-like domain-containing protein [Mycena leptocephala]|nr:kinase-like domain-containing protein [Mycena leptocephala]